LLTKTKNSAHIHGIKFFIRGKPWVVFIDDYLIFATNNNIDYSLPFASSGPSNIAIWASLFEKAWAKIMGNYLNIEGGFMDMGIRALTGVPVFTYQISDIN